MTPFYGLVFDLAEIGFEPHDTYVEEVFAGAMAQMCADAGWEIGEIEDTYAHRLRTGREMGPDNDWESHYDSGFVHFHGFELPY